MNMRFITGLAFIGNIALWIFIIAIMFVEEPLLGVGGIIGLIGFFIAYSVSTGFAVSTADYFFQPEWGVFKQKIKWANGVGIFAGGIGAVIFAGLLA